MLDGINIDVKNGLVQRVSFILNSNQVAYEFTRSWFNFIFTKRFFIRFGVRSNDFLNKLQKKRKRNCVVDSMNYWLKTHRDQIANCFFNLI